MNEKDNTSEKENVAGQQLDDDENIQVVDGDDSAAAEQEVVDPEQQIEQLNANLAKEREKYLRSLADMDNLRKRCRRDVEEARLKGQMSVLEEMLPAMDSIDMALKSIEPTEANKAVYDGMLMVHRQFLSSMERFELKPVKAVGAKFDPAFHEAVSYVPSSDHGPGEVIAEMRGGYTLGPRLLRAAMVVVSSGPAVAAPSDESAAPGTPTDSEKTDTDSGGSAPVDEQN